MQKVEDHFGGGGHVTKCPPFAMNAILHEICIYTVLIWGILRQTLNYTPNLLFI